MSRAMDSYSQNESFGSPLLGKDPEDISLMRIEGDIEAFKKISDIDSSLSASESFTALNEKNVTNLVTFIINFVITFWVGVAGVGSIPNNAQLSFKYQTLVTPVGWTFSIWTLIFIAQGAFVIGQHFPKYRSCALVQNGINYWYFFASLFQVGWIITFSFELIPLSLLMMMFILVSIIGLLISICRIRKIENTWKEYLLLKFPFELLCGWIIAAFVVNINVLIVSFHASASTQVAFAISSLVCLYIVAVIVTCCQKDLTSVIPLVMVWATAGIFFELRTPNDSIVQYFQKATIKGVMTASIATSIIILLQVLIRVTYHFTRQRQHH